MSTKDVAKNALKASKDHQYALKVYTERLEAELKTLDKLISSVEGTEEPEEAEPNEVGQQVPGAVKPVSLILPSALLSEDSPFAKDAQWRKRYLDMTTINPMKAKEQDALASAVRTENYRMHALEAQRRGLQPFNALRQHPQDYFELNTYGIDWERVAVKVASLVPGGVKRTAKECEVNWVGDRHPKINHSQWSPQEVKDLRALLPTDSSGPFDWVEIAKQLGTNRTPIDCMRHVAPRKTHTWNPESDQKLLDAVQTYGLNNWNLVARVVSEDATGHQCQKRFQDSVNPAIKRGPWSPTEDEQLRLVVDAFGTSSWLDVAEFIPGRTNNQCRERYQDRLNPHAKGKWSAAEDAALLTAVAELHATGEVTWKDVSRRVGTGRTDGMCRRRYETLQKHKEKTAAQAEDVAGSAGDVNDEPGTEAVSRPTPAKRRRKGKEHTTGDAQAEAGDGAAPPPKPRAKPRPRMVRKAAAPEPSGPSNAVSGDVNTVNDVAADVNGGANDLGPATGEATALATAINTKRGSRAGKGPSQKKRAANSDISSADGDGVAATMSKRGKGKAKAPPASKKVTASRKGKEKAVDPPAQENETDSDATEYEEREEQEEEDQLLSSPNMRATARNTANARAAVTRPTTRAQNLTAKGRKKVKKRVSFAIPNDSEDDGPDISTLRLQEEAIDTEDEEDELRDDDGDLPPSSLRVVEPRSRAPPRRRSAARTAITTTRLRKRPVKKSPVTDLDREEQPVRVDGFFENACDTTGNARSEAEAMVTGTEVPARA